MKQVLLACTLFLSFNLSANTDQPKVDEVDKYVVSIKITRKNDNSIISNSELVCEKGKEAKLDIQSNKDGEEKKLTIKTLIED